MRSPVFLHSPNSCAPPAVKHLVLTAAWPHRGAMGPVGLGGGAGVEVTRHQHQACCLCLRAIIFKGSPPLSDVPGAATAAPGRKVTDCQQQVTGKAPHAPQPQPKHPVSCAPPPHSHPALQAVSQVSSHSAPGPLTCLPWRSKGALHPRQVWQVQTSVLPGLSQGRNVDGASSGTYKILHLLQKFPRLPG